MDQNMTSINNQPETPQAAAEAPIAKTPEAIDAKNPEQVTEVKEALGENEATQILEQQPATLVDPATLPVSAAQTPVATTEEVQEEFSEQIDKKEKTWLQEAKHIINEYDEKPYDEEEASEDLQQKYMKKRFNVDIKKE